VRRRDEQSIERAEPLDFLPEPLLHGGLALLHLHVEHELGVERERVLERRHDAPGPAKGEGDAVTREAIARVERAKLGEGDVHDSAHPIGRPIERGIVEAHDVAVTRDVEVGLDVAEPERDRALEGGDRVLRPDGGAAAVCDRDRRPKVRAHGRALAVESPGGKTNAQRPARRR